MKRIGFLISLCMLALLASCDDDDLISLRISTPFISESDESTEITRSGSETSASQTVMVSAGSGMTLEATLERTRQTVTRATTALNTGVKYRVIIFKQDNVSTSGYLGYADFTVGTSGSTGGDFHVPSGFIYTFVCYSLNTANLPAFDTNSLSITANPATDDLLYTKFNQYITESSKTLSFSFKHQFSQVTVIADATAMGKNITDISSSLSPNYSGTLNLSTGTLTAGTEAARSIPWGTITAGQTVTAGACPVFTNGSSSVTVSISSVTIDGTTKTNLTASFGSNTMQTGYRYILRLKFRGVIWSPSNLKYSNGFYYLAPLSVYYSGVWDGGDYWNWCLLDPTDYTTSYSGDYNYATNDPCRLVSPQNTWRMPTKQDLDALIASGSVWTTRDGVYGRYVGTNSAAAVIANPNNYVFFPAAGIRNYGTTAMLGVGTSGHYASSSAAGSIGLLYIFFYDTQISVAAGNRLNGYTIRCVR